MKVQFGSRRLSKFFAPYKEWKFEFERIILSGYSTRPNCNFKGVAKSKLCAVQLQWQWRRALDVSFGGGWFDEKKYEITKYYDEILEIWENFDEIMRKYYKILR